jgi:hypothetical protein
MASVWCQFVAAPGDDRAGIAAYHGYSERYAQGLIPEYGTSRPHWGGFSYDYDANERAIHLHFVNLDPSGAGPLSSVRREVWVAELRGLWRNSPSASRYRAGTERKLAVQARRIQATPSPQFGESACVDRTHLIAPGLWGQFLRYGNRMNEEVTALCLAQLTELRAAEAYSTYFPYQSQLTEASTAAFNAFYGLGDRSY